MKTTLAIVALLGSVSADCSKFYTSCEAYDDKDCKTATAGNDATKNTQLASDVNGVLSNFAACKAAGTHLWCQPLLVSCGLLSSSNNQTP